MENRILHLTQVVWAITQLVYWIRTGNTSKSIQKLSISSIWATFPFRPRSKLVGLDAELNYAPNPSSFRNNPSCIANPDRKSRIWCYKIFDVSEPDSWQIWSGSCKDSLFFPEETTKSWKKCVATEFQDPVRIQNKIFKDPDKFTIDFEPWFSQETTNSWKKRVAMEL